MPAVSRLLRTIAICVVFVVLATTRTRAQSTHARAPVLVELFTSEGCSSCPPADALLARLLREQPVAGGDIIVLEEHVDYWDGLGWRDRFSSHQFTERQAQYAQRMRLDSPYTPQMIVDGTDQFVGNDAAHALRAIAQAARMATRKLVLSPITLDGSQIAGTVWFATGGSVANGDVYAAVVESMASTQVKGGENGGRTLQHVSTVRALQRIGGPMGAAPLKFSLSVPKDAPPADLRIVVFVQRAGQGAILGAVSSMEAPVPASTSALATAR